MTQKIALVILPEIYGCNAFIERVKAKYQQLGMAVFCPNLWLRAPFTYGEEAAAYTYFQRHIGFGAYRDIDYLLEELQAAYDRVFVLGFSAGAALAWRCSTCGHADGVIACYGSRIRDYLDAAPRCETLLLFAKQDGFDAAAVTERLQGKRHVETMLLPAKHGFFDADSQGYDARQAEKGWRYIDAFMKRIIEA